MAIVYRSIIGNIRDPQGELLASGTLWTKALNPITDGEVFISPEVIEVPIVNGEFTLTLAAPVEYDFKVIDEYENTVWNFQAPLNNDETVPISLAALYRLQGQPAVDSPDLSNPFWEWVADGEVDESLNILGDDFWVVSIADSLKPLPLP